MNFPEPQKGDKDYTSAIMIAGWVDVQPERLEAAVALDVHLQNCGVMDEAVDGSNRYRRVCVFPVSGEVGEFPQSEPLVSQPV